jgi:hypothetical protein
MAQMDDGRVVRVVDSADALRDSSSAVSAGATT